MTARVPRVARACSSSPAMLVAVVLAPDLPVQAAWRADLSPRQQPLVVIDGVDRVLAACPRAHMVGVRSGQRLTQARFVCPDLRHVPSDPLGATVLYEDLLHSLAALSPIVEAADPVVGLAFLDARGLERLLGDAAAVAKAAIDAASDLGLQARAGAGPTRRIARALAQRMDISCPPVALSAQGGAAFLRSLPLADPTFGIEPGDLDRLDEVGIYRAAHLYALPRAALLLRFGPPVLDTWDALHAVPEPPLVPWSAPASIDAVHRFEDAVQDRLVLERVLARMAATLAATLQARQQAASILTLRTAGVSGAMRVRRLQRWPPIVAAHDLERAAAVLLDQLYPEAPSDTVFDPVSTITLTAGGLCGAPHDQGALWGDPGNARQARIDAVLRAQMRQYGSGVVTRWQEDPLADDGWRRDDWAP